ncbi:hypothetical protein F3Y22_tig00000340pilonHSYRG00009 [Hibiscus syriacus]|uniref:Uncharacterized protein n=1 Tax=Hibiscus syriacus TaxID=106335 RepID=A0A6A3D7G5_HIBSY|nr:uncharacterized protein LOC120200255 [Hibiscus syriacus]KAE8735192.1 hypothetical protein F3Y22_tig00000340pilonHSYRG00009 [Hibiscus syriacus]
MQSQQGSRIDLGELKAQIVKKIGAERSKRYFYYLSRFLSQKLSKCEFDKSCYRIIGRHNLSLHNLLIRSILKNACHKPVHEAPVKSLILTVKRSPGREDAHDQTRSLVPNQNVDIWSNGVFLVSSPRKARSGVRDRKLRDRPSPLGPNGKVESVSPHSMTMEDNGCKLGFENGDLISYDYQRPVHHLQAVAELPEIDREGLVHSTEKPRLLCKNQAEAAVVEDGEELEQANHINISRSPLLAPLGIPFCSASVGGACKALPVASSGDFISYYGCGCLYDTETLKKRMEQIAAAEGLGVVSVECASLLNNMLDVYLTKLIRSCVDLVGSRSTPELKKQFAHKQHPQGKLMNGMWPSNHLHMQSSSGPTEVLQEPEQHFLISLLDFKVAMELNPQQLGEDWPLLLEKICVHSFE